MSELLPEFDAERSSVLNWLVEGALIYLASGLKAFVPEKVTSFTKDYQGEMDPLGNFINDCVVVLPEDEVRLRHVQRP